MSTLGSDQVLGKPGSGAQNPPGRPCPSPAGHRVEVLAPADSNSDC